MEQQRDNQLLKLLGVGFGIAVTIGGTIGTGILRKPGPIASMLDDPFLIMGIWLAVSVYAFLGVLCAIELGVSMPQAGSWYVYARRAFGNYFGFITGITSWLGTVAALGFGAYTMSEYIAILIPQLVNYLPYLAVSILAILTLFHFLGTKSGGKSQEVLSFIKAIGLLVFVVVCFANGQNLDYSVLQATAEKTTRPALFFGIIATLQAVFYTFDGWHTASYFSEENENPAKNMPKSMIIGVLMVILIYLLVNAAILYLIPLDILANSKLAASDAVLLIFGEKSAKIVTLFLMLSILGMLNAQIMFAPRVIFSMGRDGLFHKAVQRVNSLGVPSIAMPITTICSVILILSGRETCLVLSDIATFFFVMSYAAGFASLIKLRSKEPNLPRPFKVPFYPYLPYFLLICSILFLIGAVVQDLNSSKYALIFLLLSYPIFRLQQNYLASSGEKPKKQ
jgi:APA family basic amino acid/polyamine antiporter